MRNILQESPKIIRLLILCPDPEMRRDLEEFFRGDDHFPNIHLVDAVDTLVESRMIVRRLFPDVVLLVDIGQTANQTEELFQFSKELNLDFNGISTLVLTTTTKATPNYMRSAMNARAFDVIQAERLSSGRTSPILREVETLVIKADQANRPPAIMGGTGSGPQHTQTISLFSGRGGVGTSTMATALAGEIARREPNKKVVVLDLNVQFGAVAPMMGLPGPTRNLTQLIDMQLDANPTMQIEDFFPTVSVGPTSLVSVAAPPQATSELRYLSANQANSIIAALRRSFDYVIIDLPTEISDVATSAFLASDLILLVCVPELLSVRTTRQILDVLTTGNIQLDSTTKVQILFNKVGDKHMVDQKRVEQYFPNQVVARFPSDPVFINEHINSGMPIGTWKPTKKVGKGFLKELAKLYRSFAAEHVTLSAHDAAQNKKQRSKQGGKQSSLFDKFTRSRQKEAV